MTGLTRIACLPLIGIGRACAIAAFIAALLFSLGQWAVK